MYALKKFRWENPHLQPHDYSGDNSDFLSLKPPGHWTMSNDHIEIIIGQMICLSVSYV